MSFQSYHSPKHESEDLKLLGHSSFNRAEESILSFQDPQVQQRAVQNLSSQDYSCLTEDSGKDPKLSRSSSFRILSIKHMVIEKDPLL